MEEITINVFRHFRFFLKKNGEYENFMRCFRKQANTPYHMINSRIPNYIQIMMKDTKNGTGKEYYNEFGALHLIFRSFQWAYGGSQTSSTKHWCTLGLKWALYCIRNNISICSDNRLRGLISYWDSNGWIDTAKLSFEDKIVVKQLKQNIYGVADISKN